MNNYYYLSVLRGICIALQIFSQTLEYAGMVIDQTKKWISEVVVACNFCPFAAKPLKQNRVHYQVEHNTTLKDGLTAFLQECIRLDEDDSIDTSFLIFPDAFASFEDYLHLVDMAEKLLKQEKYEGIYQVAGFHPRYCFANEPEEDAANYTNRSVYPMLHLLREAQVEAALLRYANPEEIPGRNILFAREKGTAYMKMLRDSCL